MNELIEKLLTVVEHSGTSSTGKPDTSAMAHAFEDILAKQIKPIAEKLILLRDALVQGDTDEAYHQLYCIADPSFSKYDPWIELEKLCS